MTKIGLKRKQMTWRFFAMLLAVVLLFQNTALSAFAADGTPGEGATVTADADAGKSSSEGSGAENTTTGGTGAEDGTGEQTTVPGATDGNTGGQVTPGTGDSSNGGDTQPVDGNPTPGTEIPPQPGNIVYPEGNDPIVMPGENNNPDGSDTLTDDLGANGADELILEEEEETESADALNEGAEVPVGTIIRLGVSGAGGFTEDVLKDAERFDQEDWIYTHTVKTDTTIEALMSDLLSKVEPAGNVGTFDYFSTHYWDESTDEYVSLQGEDAVRYAVAHSGQIGLDLYAFFEGYAQISVKSKDSNPKTVWRMKTGDTLTLTAAATVWDQQQYKYVDVTGVSFGEWYFFQDGNAQQPVNISWNKNNPGTATIEATSVGSTEITVPLYAPGAKWPLSQQTLTVIVGDDTSEGKIPQGTTIDIEIFGAGEFTEIAKSDTLHYSSYGYGGTFQYTTENDLTLEELETALNNLNLVQSAGNIGEFSGWWFKSHSDVGNYFVPAPISDVDDVLENLQILAYFVNKRVESSLSFYSNGIEKTPINPYAIALRLNEPETQTISIRHTLSDEGGASVTGLGVQWSHEYTPSGNLSEILTIEDNGAGTVTLHPQKTGTVRLHADLVTADGNIINNENCPTTVVTVTVGSAYTELSYKAVDTAGNDVESFYPNNPSQMRTSILSLEDAAASGYEFEGWYLEDQTTPVPDGVLELTDPDNMPATVVLYAKFKKLVPITSMGFSGDLTTQGLLKINDPEMPEGFPLLSTMENVYPINHTDTILFSSDNTKVAKIVTKEGETYIQGVSPGIATIVARSQLNPSARTSLTVTVADSIVEGEEILVETKNGNTWTELPSYDRLLHKDTGNIAQYAFRATVYGTNEGRKVPANFQDVTWSVFSVIDMDSRSEDSEGNSYMDKNYVSVSQSGIVTIRSPEQPLIADIQITSDRYRYEGGIGQPVIGAIRIYITKPYTLSFSNARGSAPAAITMHSSHAVSLTKKHLDTLNKRDVKKESGYDFMGWYLEYDDDELEDVLVTQNRTLTASDLSDQFMYSCNATLVARWNVKVTHTIQASYGPGFTEEGVPVDGKDYFELLTANEQNSLCAEQFLVSLDTGALTLPLVSAKGFDFVGWYSDPACTKKITKAITVSTAASYEKVYCLVKRSVQGIGSETTPEIWLMSVGEKKEEHIDVVHIYNESNERIEHDYAGVTFTSSAPKIASVTSDGLVEAKAVGTCTITASLGPHKYSHTVRVVKKGSAVPAASIKVSLPTKQDTLLDLEKDHNKTIKLTAVVYGADGTTKASVQDVRWIIDIGGRDYATVDQKGNVKFNFSELDGARTIIVKALSKSAGCEGKMEFTVKPFYTLSFELPADMKKKIPAQRIPEGDTTDALPATTKLDRTGYNSEKWLDKDTMEEFKPGEDKMPAKNLTLVRNWEAKEITIHYEFPTAPAGAEVSYTDLLQKTGEAVTGSIRYGAVPDNSDGFFPLFQDAYRSEYGFDSNAGLNSYFILAKDENDFPSLVCRLTGFYTDASRKKMLNLSAAFKSDKTTVTIYPKLERLYKISFDYRTGNPDDNEDALDFAKNGDRVDDLAEIIRPGYRLVGFFTSESDAKKADSEGTVTSAIKNARKKAIIFPGKISGLSQDTTYYAAWEKRADVTVTYETASYFKNGTSYNVLDPPASVPDSSLAYGETLSKPTTPSATGYTFGGWYADAARTIAFDFDKSLTMDVTIYAQWIPEQFKIELYRRENWQGFEGNVHIQELRCFKTLSVDYGQSIPKEEIPLYSYYSDALLQKSVRYGTEEHYDLSDPVTENLMLTLLYYGEEGAGENNWNDIVILTNHFSTLPDYHLPDGYTWTPKDLEKPATNYASKGRVMMEIVHKETGRTISIPVWFATITGLQIDPYYRGYNSGNLYANSSITAHILPQINKKPFTSWCYQYPDIALAAIEHLRGEARHDMLTIKKPASIANADVKVTEHPAYSSTDSGITILLEASNVTKKAALKIPCTLTQYDASHLTFNLPVTLLPEPVSNHDFGIDVSALRRDGIEYPTYTFDFSGGENELKNAETLTLKGTFYTWGNAANTRNIKSVASTDGNVVKMEKLYWIDALTGARKTTRGPDDHDFEIDLKVIGTGSAILTASINDAAKTKLGMLRLHVLHDDPVLSTCNFTLNKLKTRDYGKAVVTITKGYQNPPLALEITNVQAPASVTADSNAMCDWFEFLAPETWNTAPDTLQEYGYGYLSISDTADISKMATGTYTLTLANFGKELEKKVTVRVTADAPKIKVTQSAALNLRENYGTLVYPENYGATLLSFSSPAEPVMDVLVEKMDDSPYVSAGNRVFPGGIHDESGSYYDIMDGVYIKKNPDMHVTTSSNKKLTLYFTLYGYRDLAVKQDFTLKVTDRAPVIKLDSATATVFPEIGELRSIPLIMLLNGELVEDLTGATLTPDKTLAAYYEAETETVDSDPTWSYQRFKLVLKDQVNPKTASGKLTVSHPAFTGTVTVSFKATVAAKKALKPALSASTVKLNRNAGKDFAWTQVTCNTPLWHKPSPDFEVIWPTNMTQEQREKLNITLNGTLVHVGWIDPENPLPNGNYKLKLRISYDWDSEKTYDLPLTVNVHSTALNKTVTVSQSGSMTTYGGNMKLTTKLSNLNGQVIKLNLVGKDADYFLTEDHGGFFRLISTRNQQNIIVGSSCDVTVASAIVRMLNGETVVVPVNKKLTVKYK